MTPIASLQELGLTSDEAAIYITLLQSNGLSVSQLAPAVKLNRTTAYPILKKMAAKGFISQFIKNGRQVYIAERPQNIVNYYQKKLRGFTNTLPALESLEKKSISSHGVRFIETTAELKRFYTNILNEYKNRSYRIIGDLRAWENLDRPFFTQYRIDRGEANISTQILLSSTSKPFNPTDYSLLREVRYLPPKYLYKSTMDIYDDKVLVVSPDMTALAVVIAIPAMVDVFKSTFDALWDSSIAKP